ncbi:hypothetical protein [Mesorhizobium sp. M0040]|uniref:hypothetical protein n=1 Tax=Mesorhizobium sp. M0040 TaxID=2956855 RepID=UPI00333D7662
MTKITAEHLARSAFVYIRQSTADQLMHNQESQRRQYGLADHARQLGWAKIEVIDDDLGRSDSTLSSVESVSCMRIRVHMDDGEAKEKTCSRWGSARRSHRHCDAAVHVERVAVDE